MILDRNTVLLEGKIKRTSRFGNVFEEENQLANIQSTGIIDDSPGVSRNRWM
jgi:hypothetical protein